MSFDHDLIKNLDLNKEIMVAGNIQINDDLENYKKIEGSSKESRCEIEVNSNWKNLNGVQTNWPDGTILKDYSQANITTTTVYGGGKVDISIPPCDGSANNGRRGYCIWAPDGIQTNYVNSSESITQEWEMADDLGDSHVASLQQGGKLPSNSQECRVVGKVFPKANSTISVELYPLFSTLSINLLLLETFIMLSLQ